jgi:hypothetical protein
MTFPAIFAIVVGIGMIGQWAVSYASKQIPELTSEPIRIWFHIAGEMVTAITLIVSGIGLLAVAPWAPTLFFVSIGMLLYTAIVSPGYFAQKGQWIWVLIFGLVITLAIISIFVMIENISSQLLP